MAVVLDCGTLFHSSFVFSQHTTDIGTLPASKVLLNTLSDLRNWSMLNSRHIISYKQTAAHHFTGLTMVFIKKSDTNKVMISVVSCPRIF